VLEFRKDINGLRAIAVVAVVLFHFGVSGFNGGFVGVDIFFVISGYLMTGIILGKLEKKQFSLLGFYLARAQRIIPALLFLCVSVLIILCIFLPPTEFEKLGVQIASAATFVSNIQFWRDAGYFDSSAHEKWLLHTWSLSVEWQFYIIYPIVILFIQRIFSTSSTKWFILAGALISFCLSAVLPLRWLDAGFYLLPTRAWEMMVGGLLFIFPFTFKKNHSLALEILGVIFIVISVGFLDSHQKWPGWLAALPVLGASLIIFASNASSKITGNFGMQYIGKISYSFYLWHWPICVALFYFNSEKNIYWIIAGILSSFLIAILSFHFIEKTTRQWGQNGNNVVKPLVIYAAASLTLTTLGFIILFNHGMPGRLDPTIVAADYERYNQNPRRAECNVTVTNNPKSPMCIFGGKNKEIGLIVVGDSHANATITAIAAAIPKNKGGALYLGADGCMLLENLTSTFFPACNKYNKQIMQFLDTQLANIPVIVVNRTTAALQGPNENEHKVLTYINDVSNQEIEYRDLFQESYVNTICHLAQKRKVFILGPIPEMGVNVPKEIIRNKTFGNANTEVSISMEDYIARHRYSKKIIQTAAETCNAIILDPAPYLCDTVKCRGSINTKSLYYDDDHLSETGNRYLIPLFRNIWD
jgi:peptidoglycan/LPS O-acetylase OafA/YrhL